MKPEVITGSMPAPRRWSARRAAGMLLGRLIGALLVCGLSTGQAAAETVAGAATAVQGGVAVSLRTRPATDDGGGFLAELQFTDAASGAPITGMRPAAWMQWRRSPSDLELSCEDRARSFVSGSLGSKADVDLNAYRLVSLNQDASVTFINPYVRIRNSRLEAVVLLPGPGYDWVHDAVHHRLVISLREQGQLAIVDTAAHQLLGLVDLGAATQPTRLALSPDGRHAWVGLDGAAAVARVDLDRRSVTHRIAVGVGPHLLKPVPDKPWLLVSHAGSGEVSLLDAESAKVLGRVAVGQGAVALDYSAAAARAVVLAGKSGELVLLGLDTSGPRVDGRVSTGAGALSLLLIDDGRHALVGNVQKHEVALVDLARRQVRHTVPVAAWPDQMMATREFAYVRSQTTSKVTLLSIEQARAGRLQPLVVDIGRGSAADLPAALNVAPLMAAAPEGNGIYAAVAADAQTYRYNEGLMVPSGSFTNYRKASRGLMVIDESLQERGPGRFQAPLRPTRSGMYDVVIRNATPALTACLSLPLQAMAPDPALAAQTAQVAPPAATLVGWQRQGQTLRVKVSLKDAKGRAIEQGDLQLLVLGPAAGWQRRATLAPADKSLWLAELTLPPDAVLDRAQVLVQSQTHGLSFMQGRLGELGRQSPAPAPSEGDRHERR